MITIKLKRLMTLYNSGGRQVASIRTKANEQDPDEQYESALKNGGCRIVVGDRVMTLTPEQLVEKKFRVKYTVKKSKFGGGRDFYLWDYIFVDDKKPEKEGESDGRIQV